MKKNTSFKLLKLRISLEVINISIEIFKTFVRILETFYRLDFYIINLTHNFHIFSAFFFF